METKTYNKRSNAQRGARSHLKNDKAQEGVDFTTVDDGDGNWSIEYPKTAATAAPTEVAPSLPAKTHDLGAGWWLNVGDNGEATVRNPDKGQRIDLPKESVDLLRSIFRAARRAPSKRTGPNKREQAAALLTRKEGATRADILALTEWPAVSIPALAKASKLKLRKVKEGKSTRYYGTAA